MATPKTYGLTHIALHVKDIKHSVKFYHAVFDVETMYNQDGFAQVTTPGSNDIIVFEESKKSKTGTSGSIAHFGFRLKDPNDIEAMADKIKKAGGVITEKGEFVPGEPYIFFKDPDGYLVEVWHELIPDSHDIPLAPDLSPGQEE